MLVPLDVYGARKRMSNYAWIVVGDPECGLTRERLGRVGPHSARTRWSVDKIVERGHRFRMLSDSGDVRFTGYVAGRISGPEPLLDFGRDQGCRHIEYLHEGAWRRLTRRKQA